MPPRQSEIDKWREQAHHALAQFSKAMDFFMFSTAQLVRLTEVHMPDEFSHCVCCKAPWPCESMQIVRSIGSRYTELQKETADE